ncbi:MAG: HSP90 family protein [Lachnospiraceae bacterium]|nr:HSP90 family protein [Lachnospiraceae bacterium]
MSEEKYRFQVNLGGMIEILSDHLYSSPDVYIRELLQNGADAITAKRKWHAAVSTADTDARKDDGAIVLEIEEGQKLIFTDNGLGLTEEEIHQFLAIIGESSKRELEDGELRSDYIGRFGIGLLSCFMVSDEIRMLTRSCKSEEAPVLEWQGRPDGTYLIRSLNDDEEASGMPKSGTQVILYAKEGKEDYFTKKTIRKLLIYYGILLPFPVIIRQKGKEEQLNPIYLPWEGRQTNKQELMLFGQMMFEEQFMDCIPFSSKRGDVSGVAYILNYPVLPSAKGKHRIYLKNMLLTERGEGLLPDWAVFTRCIVNAMSLRPTASREGFYVDEELNEAQDAIEECLISYIAELAETSPEVFTNFFHTHHLTLTSLALASPRLFGVLSEHYEFETTRGIRTGYELRNCGEALVYAPTESKYKQLSQLFFAQDQLLINVSYVHSLDMLRMLGQVYDLEVRVVDEWNVEDLMQELTPEDQDDAFAFQKAANRILKAYDCRAEIKYFSPYNQPTFYLMDEKILFKRQIMSSRSQADSMFFNMLDAFQEELPSDTAAVLYFNYNNPLVKKLAVCDDEGEWKLFVEILYVQALQIGGFVLHNNEMGMLNRNIMRLMERGLSDV